MIISSPSGTDGGADGGTAGGADDGADGGADDGIDGGSAIISVCLMFEICKICRSAHTPRTINQTTLIIPPLKCYYVRVIVQNPNMMFKSLKASITIELYTKCIILMFRLY